MQYFRRVKTLQNWHIKIEFNIDLNTQAYGGFTPFHSACQAENLNIVKLLIENSFKYNIDLNATSLTFSPNNFKKS